jgi:hypothetical protein
MRFTSGRRWHRRIPSAGRVDSRPGAALVTALNPLDALTIRGWTVSHIFSSGKASRHEPTPFLRVVDGQITCPKEPGGSFDQK